MDKTMRIMTENPLNAETPIERLRTWITDNHVFFKRNLECSRIRQQCRPGTCRHRPGTVINPTSPSCTHYTGWN